MMSNENKTNINWFPGHMAKTKNQIKEDLKQVDLIAEIVDARIPISSCNIDLESIYESKPKIIVLNKSDLVKKEDIMKWVKFYSERNIPCISFSMKDSRCKKFFKDKVKSVIKEKLNRWKSRNVGERSIRIMIVGIPNVGKSAFINSFAKSKKAKVENKPGVTRKNQWFSVGDGLEFLDTPGVLQPKIETETAAYNLALTGAIKDSILDVEDLAVLFASKAKNSFPQDLKVRYKLEDQDFENMTPFEIIELIGKKRGMIISGGEIDTLRVSKMVIEEFRSGKIGKIMIEKPQD